MMGGVAGGVLFAGLASRFTRQFELYIPARFKTVRDLIPPVLSSEHIKWTRAQVSELVKKLVMEQLGVPESKYTEDSHFINDLGMG